MTHFATWISPDVLRALGWSLVHFLWQGAAIAALLAAGMAMCRNAAARYALAVGALTLMLAAPVITFTLLSHGSANTNNSLAPAISLSSLQKVLSQTATASNAIPAALYPSSPLRADALLWFVEIWFAGVIILSLRTVGGVLLVERLRRRDAKPASARLRELCVSVQQRLGIARVIRYCESTLLDAPAVVGWFRPAILLPITALTGLSDDQLQAVIAHELAHIRRFDNFVNLFQIVVETLLFYHPAVWWASKRIRAERENCCDDAAISVCDDAVVYARALALLAESRTAPTLAMAANGGPLADRVARLLVPGRARSEIRSAGIAASLLCLAGAVVAANGFLGLAHTAFASVVPEHTRNFSEPVDAADDKEPVATPASKHNPSDAVTVARANSTVSNAVRSVVRSAVAETTNDVSRLAYALQEQTQESDAQKPKESYVDGMKAAGFENLTADELIALKIQGVTPDYVRQLHELGLKPSVDELIGMRVQGITPDYVRNMRAAGFNVDTDKLIGMRVQGITPDYVRGMHDVGIDTNNVDELIGLKVQGVTPDYIKGMRDAGVEVNSVDIVIGLKVQGVSPDYVAEMKQLGINPKSDELIGLKVQGVTPEYIKEMRAAGLEVNADRAIGMKVQGVSPEYVKGMHDLGFKPDVDELIGMRVQGVSPEYIRDIRATGLNPSANQIIGLRVQGVTADYIKSLQAAGFKDISVHTVIRAKVQGVTPEFIQEARKHGFQNLDLDKLIELKNAGVF